MNYGTSLKRSLCMVGIFVLAGGCKGGHGDAPVPPQLPVASVGVQVVVEAGVGSQIEVAGTVRAVERASIAPQVSGQIIEMPVVLGSQVRKGDLLVKISAGEIAAKALQAQAQLEQVRRNLAREERLQKEEASTRETVNSLRDQARITEAALKEAQTMLEYATISAPFSGIVTRKIASVGDMASPGVVLLEMENDKALQVVAQVPEELILKVRKGDVLLIAVPAAGVSLSGEVAEVAPAADPFSRTAPVKINIAAGGDLRPGQFARVTLTGTGEKSLVISEKALVSFGQMERVFVVEDKSGVAGAGDNTGASKVARLRLVRTGAHHTATGTTDSRVEIMAGLSLGDRVVVEGAEKLQDGQPLEVKP